MCVGLISPLDGKFFSKFLLEHQHEKIAAPAATFLYWCSILMAKYVAPAKSHVSGQLAKYVGNLRCGEIVQNFIM